jgi:hypothetical protein
MAVALVAFCVLMSSGHLDTFDGSSELAEAVHVCATGHVAATRPITSEFVPKNFASRSTAFYDANDLGGTLLMLPAACLGVVDGAKDPADTSQLTTVTKGLASLTFAAVGGIAAVFMLYALTELVGLAAGAWWTLAFLFATGFLAYVKGTWDVLPAATGVAMLAWVVVRATARANPMRSRRALLLAAAAVGIASLARYTLTPFLIVAAAAALWPVLCRARRSARIQAAGLLTLALISSFAWNEVRTGEFWRPGQAYAAFGHPDLSAHYLLSTVGLFFGIQEGLLFFAPICLLGYFAVLQCAHRAHGTLRGRWLQGLILAVAYVVTVCLLHAWEVFGWGPRYLVPIFPALFAIAVYAIQHGIIPRLIGYAAVVFGLVTQIPLVFADWHALVAVVGLDSRAPNPIVGLWASMLDGLLRGYGIGSAGDPRALQVPDTWWWHSVANHLSHVIGLLVLLMLIAGLLLVFARGIASPESRA